MSMHYLKDYITSLCSTMEFESEEEKDAYITKLEETFLKYEQLSDKKRVSEKYAKTLIDQVKTSILRGQKNRTWKELEHMIYKARQKQIGISTYWGSDPNRAIQRYVNGMRKARAEDIQATKTNNQNEEFCPHVKVDEEAARKAAEIKRENSRDNQIENARVE